ncbi:hypothetical protein [Streptomyces sp. NPDC052225]|uniref:hypothetical protein n=1 Tax=Streptomyces sp. NPDC052225 TaxID=3154949 RepID=UPI00342D4890
MDRSPLREPMLLLDARRRLLNTCVLCEAVRWTLSEVYDTDTSTWELVCTRTVPRALPVMTPPPALNRSARVARGLYVWGDLRSTGSV